MERRARPPEFFVLDEIVRYVDARSLPTVHMLNLSGTNEGKPDTVLFDLLAENRRASGCDGQSYPSGEGRLALRRRVGGRLEAPVQVTVLAPVQETVRWRELR